VHSIEILDQSGFDELGFANDTQDRSVLRHPLEPCLESRVHELPSTFVLVRGFPRNALEFGASRPDELLEELGFAREVDVERPLRHAGRARDVDDGCVVVSALTEDLLGRVDQLESGAFTLLRTRRALSFTCGDVRTSLLGRSSADSVQGILSAHFHACSHGHSWSLRRGPKVIDHPEPSHRL
jgi:hypothetical protein